VETRTRHIGLVNNVKITLIRNKVLTTHQERSQKELNPKIIAKNDIHD